MLRLVVLTVLLANAFSATVTSDLIANSRIVGGDIATIDKLPYQVALLHFKVHRCGAAIINPTTIISAAHCTEGSRPQRFHVLAGTSYRGRGGVMIPVVNYYNHPNYDSDKIDFDLSVIFIETPLEFNDKIQPIALPEFNEPIPTGAIGVVSGWGRLFEGGTVPELLRYVEIPVVDQKECATIYKSDLTDNMLCAGVNEGGKDACQQDSGGPFVVDHKLVGVVSWAIGCGRPNHPGVYARVAVMRDWVDEVLEKELKH